MIDIGLPAKLLTDTQIFFTYILLIPYTLHSILSTKIL